MAALDEDLNPAEGFRLVDLLADLLERERVPFPVLRPPVERAEAAVGDADVRVVDVSVDDERDDAVRMPLLPHAVRFAAELQQRCVRVEVEDIGHRSLKVTGETASWWPGARAGCWLTLAGSASALPHAAGRKASVPLGTRPRATRRRKNSVRPARCSYDRP